MFTRFVIIKVAFAVSPIPAYLPQYLELCRPQQVHHQHQNQSQPQQGGLSSISIFLLLYSHSLRLFYFLTATLVLPFIKSEETITSSTTTVGQNDEEQSDKDIYTIHYDLVLQSIIMITVQLLLLSAVLGKKQHYLQQKKTSNPRIQQYPNSILTSTSTKHYKPFQWILHTSPFNYWKWHDIRQYVEFILLLTFLTFLLILCRTYAYSKHTTVVHDTILLLRNCSILLESCLALPQIWLNYQKKYTGGLSVIMVSGWVVGDLMKLVYFLMGNMSPSPPNSLVKTDGGGHSSSSFSIFFVLGSLFALLIDLVVILQIFIWYPTKQVQEMKKNWDCRRRMIAKRFMNQDLKSAQMKRSNSFSLDVDRYPQS